MARRTSSRRRSRPFHRSWKVRLAGAALLLLAAAAAWLLWPLWREPDPFHAAGPAPSRLYGAPLELTLGAAVARDAVVSELEAQGYRRVAGAPPPGAFRVEGGRLQVNLRPHPTAAGRDPGGILEARFAGRWVDGLLLRGREVERAALTPPLLTSYYGPELTERWPVRLEEVPQHLVEAVLAAEDDGFFHHPGLSPSGIARALWVNLRGGELAQGGSTVTQQLVKNVYLTQERTLRRKLREAALAVAIELRYDKREILEAYFNAIYLGKTGSLQLVGVGAGSRAWLGKPPAELSVGEAALLAGMIRSPGAYAPDAAPGRARARRDWVIGRLEELGWIGEAQAEAARAEPVPERPSRAFYARRAPYFAVAAAREARDRFGVGELADRGHVLLSTLRRGDQAEAEAALGWGLDALEEGWEKGRRSAGSLQGALVSVDPRSGAVLAWVGGRDWSRSQFDRVSQARRQAGSAFKPVVYAAALEGGVVAPSTVVRDDPLTVRTAGRTWSPQNDDDEFHGAVTVREALERSMNVATARVALGVGLERIVELARRLGVESPLEPYPSLALGAFEVTPLELATVYATLAAGGERPPVHGLEAVLDPRGLPLDGAPLPPREKVLSPQGAYLLTSILQGVLERGTGRAARAQGVTDPLAGKTGTSDDRRDSWFAGYSPDRATLVWVGYDDNTPTRLSGARAALPVWARFVWSVRPAAGYPAFRQPPGIVTAVVDPDTGQLATDRCPRYVTEVFLQGRVPREICRRHGGWLAQPLVATDGGEVEGKDLHPVKRWLRKVLGRDGG